MVADLEAALEALLWRLRNRPVAPFLAALMSGPPDDAALVARRARYVDTLLEPFHAALRAAVPPVPAAERDELVSLVAGPVVLAWLSTGRPPTQGEGTRRTHRSRCRGWTAPPHDEALAPERDARAGRAERRLGLGSLKLPYCPLTRSAGAHTQFTPQAA